jgi:dolichyl-phosphate beta-glucosyltransferase
MKQPYLSVVIPAYNEAKRLPNTLLDIDKHLAHVPFPYEILVVDNNSKDATLEIVKRFSAFIKNLRVIECRTQGKGAAVQKGMLEAQGKIRLFTDADNSTSIEHFFLMEEYFPKKDGEGFDVVIGSRDIEGAKMVPPQPWYKRTLGNLGNLVIQVLLLRHIPDTQCGFKAFTEKAALDIFPKITILGWGFDVEALVVAKEHGYAIKQIPVTWVNDTRSTVKLSGYITTLLEVFKIKLKSLQGIYRKS